MTPSSSGESANPRYLSRRIIAGGWVFPIKLPVTASGTRAIEGRAERLARLEKLTYEEALTGQVLIGTPQTVTERLRDLQEELGVDGILAELNCGGLIPHQQVMTALHLLCEEVKPRFH